MKKNLIILTILLLAIIGCQKQIEPNTENIEQKSKYADETINFIHPSSYIINPKGDEIEIKTENSPVDSGASHVIMFLNSEKQLENLIANNSYTLKETNDLTDKKIEIYTDPNNKESGRAIYTNETPRLFIFSFSEDDLINEEFLENLKFNSSKNILANSKRNEICLNEPTITLVEPENFTEEEKNELKAQVFDRLQLYHQDYSVCKPIETINVEKYTPRPTDNLFYKYAIGVNFKHSLPRTNDDADYGFLHGEKTPLEPWYPMCMGDCRDYISPELVSNHPELFES